MGNLWMRVIDDEEGEHEPEWLALLLHEYFLECDQGECGSLEFDEDDPLSWVCRLPASRPWGMRDAEFMHMIEDEYKLLKHWNFED